MSWADPARWTTDAVARRKAQAAARQRAYKKRHPAATGTRTRPFVGVDGEGAGVDREGRQALRLLRCGERELWFGGARLGTADCLEFLLRTPADALPVGYYSSYDATMILRDLPQHRVERLLAPAEFGPGKSRYTYWRDFAIEWRPKQYFRVARRIDPDRYGVVPGSARTVHEVSGFFRHSFLEALRAWGVGTPHQLDRIGAGKERRGGAALDPDDRAYCELECDLLAELMERFRAACREMQLIPTAWRGAGYLAALLHKRHGTPRREDLPERAPAFSELVNHAFFAGRFELLKIGHVAGPIYEADLNSTYAAMLPRLPCPRHTIWRPMRRLEKYLGKGGHYVAEITFDHPQSETPLCNLPVRHRGRLLFPRQAGGVYWGAELDAACRAGTVVTDYFRGWRAEQCCDCHPYRWVHDLYAERVRLGADTRGYPLKLALAALYGKLCQREGSAPYRDIVSAGLVTALVRGILIDAYANSRESVVMIASDAIYSTVPLPLDYGTGLGQWELVEREDIFTVQPGLYWSSSSAHRPRTRGIPYSRIIDRRGDFEAAWRGWLANPDGRPPQIPIVIPEFVGFRLAMERGDFLSAGSWKGETHRVGFGWTSKRARDFRICEGHVATSPLRGSPGLVSEPYDPAELTEFAERQRIEETAPDFLPWGNTGE